jgi:proton-dependent oligopeptide transporter, POT family
MQLHGIPNDFMQNIDPLVIVIFIPIMDRLVYPTLRRMGFELKPITRIFIGFILAAFGMVYAAFVQHLIYTSGPCYEFPASCRASKRPDGSFAPNNVHVVVQAPAYLFIGVSEIFASVTGLEYAFTKAPASMKSFIMSIFLLTSAVGSVIGAALAPSAKDPYLTWLYIGLAAACLGAGVIFWILYSRYNKMEDQMNELENLVEKPQPVERVIASGRESRRHASDDEDEEDAIPLNDGGPSNDFAKSDAV